jgi:hypothetical protein
LYFNGRDHRFSSSLRKEVADKENNKDNRSLIDYRLSFAVDRPSIKETSNIKQRTKYGKK